jgi:ribosomal protein S12 methylthiotransferase
MRHKKVYLHPAGCPKATVDLEKIGGELEARGFEIVPTPEGAGVGLLFGCGFIEDAKRESIDDILSLAELKRKGDLRHLIVVGCLPEKYAESLATELPEVDAFIGNSELESLSSFLDGLTGDAEGSRPRTAGARGGKNVTRSITRMQARTAPWTRTVLINDGCDNACTYCAIPQMRGALRSRSMPEILAEIDFVVGQGAREIVLAGQDTASYGKDLGERALGGLLEEAASKHPGIWVRLSYANPDNLESDIGNVIGRHSNICSYMDIPIQHASPKILKAMGRRDDPSALLSTIGALRDSVPNIALRTSVIVGFPGEAEDDMQALESFLGEIEFDMVGVFGFSPQPGTPAAALPDQVPDEVIQERIMDVVSRQEGISRRKMEGFVGRELQVLVEGGLEGDHPTGRSQYDMAEIDRCIRLKGCDAGPGTFAKVRIESVSAPYEWTGVCLPAGTHML